MKVKDIMRVLEQWAPTVLQEDYDNAGLQVGSPDQEVGSALIALDCTEEVVAEAVERGCDLIIAHHPVIFRGLKSITGRTGVERTLLAAIRGNVAIYAIHTNLDNVITGVNAEIGARLGLQDLRILDPKPGQLRKLVVFVPHAHAEAVRKALFDAGAGRIGFYDECSFGLEGHGTFRGGEGSEAYVGRKGERHTEPETRIETIFHTPLERSIVTAMLKVHPYEEVAYDIYPLANSHREVGSGAIGRLPAPLPEADFLDRVKSAFGVGLLKHTALRGKPVERVAVCGGSGAFLIGRALAAGADAYITADVKYHEFFGAEGQLLLADIGHYPSERFTMELIQRHLLDKLPTFAAHLTETVTDPVHIR